MESMQYSATQQQRYSSQSNGQKQPWKIVSSQPSVVHFSSVYFEIGAQKEESHFYLLVIIAAVNIPVLY
jgi:hypothetical protein